MIFVSYEGGSKAYRVYDPSSRRVHVMRDVVFDEGASWDWDARGGGEQNDYDNFSVEYSVELIGGAAPAPVPPGATGEQQAEAFRAYVRPAHHPTLTDYCRELTGIEQADVDAGVELCEALRAHESWLEPRGVKNAAATAMAGGGGSGFAVVTWGDWDCRTMLEGECRFKGIDDKPDYFDRWINLKVPFEQVFVGGGAGHTRRLGLEEAVRTAGLAFEGRPHSGLDDARNTGGGGAEAGADSGAALLRLRQVDAG
ncbi:hypothetical protein E2562_021879 [Oryza meyeriana var. granulata]|uniref:Uncharacterized protein n=1 Tax=Oryza meyeriana var. granulata TaxID=110450 RepID=A0A6G1C974_9ORYZ|nr:hypothetical protein E2562_021879 [Oryza meyeriana var. granulata]